MQIKNPTDPATESQVSFLNSLIDSKQVEDKWKQVAKARIEKGLTKGEASVMVEWFRSQPAAAFKALANGVYSCTDGVYIVKTSKNSGRQYAMKWNGSNAYVYEVGHIRTVRASGTPLPVEQAAALGINTGFCIICGARLTDEKSLARGIGPVCEKSQRALVGAP